MSSTAYRFLPVEVVGDFLLVVMVGEMLIRMPFGGAGGGIPIPGSSIVGAVDMAVGLNHMASSSSLILGAIKSLLSLLFLSFFLRNIVGVLFSEVRKIQSNDWEA